MINFIANLDEGKIILGGKRVVLHCHHYNTTLQRTLDDAFDDIATKIQVKAGKRLTLELLKDAVNEGDTTSMLNECQEIFKAQGLGILDFSNLSENKVIVKNSHYGMACYQKFGEFNRGVCYLAKGFILAALELVKNITYDYDNLNEVSCISQDPESSQECVFEVNL